MPGWWECVGVVLVAGKGGRVMMHASSPSPHTITIEPLSTASHPGEGKQAIGVVLH